MKPYNAFSSANVTPQSPSQRGQTPSRQPRGVQKHTLQLVCAVALVIVGSGLLISGFIVPPAGEIHPSVLIAFGEILTFVGALFGIDYHYKAKAIKP